ncbi:hypothetical protein MRB53_021403 [Persea americana]|uniref:Uncharacterized protein n=1 Tax=Persea americana TaxID=3435 RepID=A0ACC2L3W9_PERAE|nr:hypothetical protein MRB53_021403 [Persea americana]
MVGNSKDSFTFSAIGKFVGRRPLLEQLEQLVQSSRRLSKPCLISLTEKDCPFAGHISSKCPFRAKPGLLSPPAIAIHQKNPSITVVTANATSSKRSQDPKGTPQSVPP